MSKQLKVENALIGMEQNKKIEAINSGSLNNTLGAVTRGDRQSSTRKLMLGKFGLGENPRHQHCTLQWKGRNLLGKIMGAEYSPVLSQTLLTIRHFNGEPWPLKPAAMVVDILIRDYEQDQNPSPRFATPSL